MKVFVMSFVLLLSSSVLSKNIELKFSSTYKKGNQISKVKDVRVIALMGKEFEIPPVGEYPLTTKLNVTNANDELDQLIDGKELIKINGKISILENGIMKKVSSPSIVMEVGKEATISRQNDNGTFYEMKVLAVKTSEKI